MSDYIIATSSTSDLPRTWLDAHHIPFISYTYTVNGALCEDDCREESREKVYIGMRNGDLLRTSMINEFVYYDFFKSLLETGRDVIFLDMSQKMSASFVNANMAAEKIRTEFPEQRLYVMDTLCISGGLGLLVEHMVERMERGAGFDEVIAWGRGKQAKNRSSFYRRRFELSESRRESIQCGGAGRLRARHQACSVCAGRRNTGCGQEGARTQSGAACHSGRRISRFEQSRRSHRAADSHSAGRLPQRRGVRAGQHSSGLSPDWGDHYHESGCGHRRALRTRSADDILSLQRQKP